MGEIYRAVLKLRPDLMTQFHDIARMQGVVGPPLLNFLDAHFPLKDDKFGWSGVALDLIGQRLLLGRRDA